LAELRPAGADPRRKPEAISKVSTDFSRPRRPLVLASASPIRAEMLRRAGLDFRLAPVRLDEAAMRDALLAEGARPRDVADALAEAKAMRAASRNPDALVLGCDQVLDLDGEILSKPADIDAARAQLLRLRGRTHRLWSAAVLYEAERPVWRHVGEARLTMRSFSDAWLEAYLAHGGPSLCESVGSYKIEESGIRLFSQVEGDHFTILGLPLLALLNGMAIRGDIPA
jgi:septum formation protein